MRVATYYIVPVDHLGEVYKTKTAALDAVVRVKQETDVEVVALKLIKEEDNVPALG